MSIDRFSNFILRLPSISMKALLLLMVSCSAEKPHLDGEVTPATATPVVAVEDTLSIMVADLGKVAVALEKYKRKHRRYPFSSKNGVEWDTLYSIDGESRTDWIEELVPEFLFELPRDPRKSDTAFHRYMYVSDGANYKLLSITPSDLHDISIKFPNLIDPVRPEIAYGYWTVNAQLW